jgi:hypothetical protein
MTAIDRPTANLPSIAVVRLLTWSQAVLWGGYLLVLAKLLIAGLDYGGFGFQPFGDDHTMYDPKDVFGWGIPEYILHLPMFFITVFGALPAAVLAMASLPFAVLLWRARDPRRWLLGVSTLLSLAFLAVQLTPFHSLIVEWMLD